MFGLFSQPVLSLNMSAIGSEASRHSGARKISSSRAVLKLDRKKAITAQRNNGNEASRLVCRESMVYNCLKRRRLFQKSARRGHGAAAAERGRQAPRLSEAIINLAPARSRLSDRRRSGLRITTRSPSFRRQLIHQFRLHSCQEGICYLDYKGKCGILVSSVANLHSAKDQISCRFPPVRK